MHESAKGFVTIVLPLMGLLVYFDLCQQMKRRGVPRPPYVELFILFFTYGGLVQVMLTSFIANWSGMASLGALYLIFVSPLVVGITASGLWPKRRLSSYHRWTCSLAIAWFGVWGVHLAVGLCVVWTSSQ